jgi:hypothetical protein
MRELLLRFNNSNPRSTTKKAQSKNNRRKYQSSKIDGKLTLNAPLGVAEINKPASSNRCNMLRP